MKRIDLPALTRWITAAALQHPHDLVAVLQQRLGVARPAARRVVARLVELQWLQREGSARHPLFRPGALRQVVQRYPLDGLQEDLPWSRDFAPFFELSPALRRMTLHLFSELLNNAIDHSEGTQVTVSLRQTPTQLQLLVSDDGRGLFDQLGASFALPDPQHAMLELAKGKLTSDPARHGGRGLFFCARLADVFDLHANAVAFQRRDWDDGRWRPGRALNQRGTSVYAAIALDTTRTLESVLAAHSLDGLGLQFQRTVVPLQLIANGDFDGLESRAQARRVAARLAQFDQVDLDFAGIPRIGHSFADELFRVLAPRSLAMVPLHMAAPVAAMVAAVRDQAMRSAA